MKTQSWSTPVAMCAMAMLAGSALGEDYVTQWQSTYQDVIRQTGGAPCPVSRAGPMMSLAIYDAMNGIDLARNGGNGYAPYQAGLPAADPSASKKAAAATAAYHCLTAMHSSSPSNMTLIHNTYVQQMNSIPDSAAKSAGAAYGLTVAEGLMNLRAGDGYDGDPSYTPGTNPGDWRQTPDGPNVPAFSPHWGNVTPWGVASASAYRPTRLTDYGSMANLLASQEYADNINGAPGIPGVKDLGSRDSVLRTAEQTEIAWFWANDRDGTAKPPGQLVEISKVVANDKGLGVTERARMFALANMAMADACIAAWDSKYNTPIDLWRPIDAIRETQDDSNPLTIADPSWTPLNDFSPPFPAYVSGHATMSAAHAGIMAALFGDDTTFTVGSDEFAINTALGYDADLTRTFSSFSEAAWENALSRVYLGVHYYFDSVDGNTLGYQIASEVFASNLGRIPAPSGLALLMLGAIASRARRR